MAALARRRDEYEKGVRKRKVSMVCESLRLMKSRSCEDGGNPAARKRDMRRPRTNGKRYEEETRDGETRPETANGRRRRAGVEVK